MVQQVTPHSNITQSAVQISSARGILILTWSDTIRPKLNNSLFSFIKHDYLKRLSFRYGGIYFLHFFLNTNLIVKSLDVQTEEENLTFVNSFFAPAWLIIFLICLAAKKEHTHFYYQPQSDVQAACKRLSSVITWTHSQLETCAEMSASYHNILTLLLHNRTNLLARFSTCTLFTILSAIFITTELLERKYLYLFKLIINYISSSFERL